MTTEDCVRESHSAHMQELLAGIGRQTAIRILPHRAIIRPVPIALQLPWDFRGWHCDESITIAGQLM